MSIKPRYTDQVPGVLLVVISKDQIIAPVQIWALCINKPIMQCLECYNQARPDSKLDERTPDEAYTVMLPMVGTAAYDSI